MTNILHTPSQLKEGQRPGGPQLPTWQEKADQADHSSPGGTRVHTTISKRGHQVAMGNSTLLHGPEASCPTRGPQSIWAAPVTYRNPATTRGQRLQEASVPCGPETPLSHQGQPGQETASTWSETAIFCQGHHSIQGHQPEELSSEGLLATVVLRLLPCPDTPVRPGGTKGEEPATTTAQPTKPLHPHG